MISKIALLALALFTTSFVQAQHTFSCTVKDSLTQEALFGVTAIVENTSNGATSDADGKIVINNLPAGETRIVFSYVGYQEKVISIQLPQSAELIVFLSPSEEELESVIISSTRTNTRIEDLPTKIEVIGAEELTEENGLKPGNLASMLGDIASIQIQQTSATTGNSEIRIQGLDGQYTQLLRDGIPLFGGYSGSFGILQIPPLDLKQVEIIKGASSTLYGGDAIAGLINLISKIPQTGVTERSVGVNLSSTAEMNLNGYFSKGNEKFGGNIFGAATYQRQADVDEDDFSDIPRIGQLLLHPAVVIYPGKMNTITISLESNYENRKGGDMKVLGDHADSLHQYYVYNTSIRNTPNIWVKHTFNESSNLLLKASVSHFWRDIESNTFSMTAQQVNYYSELSFFKRFAKDRLVAGLNINGENFNKLKGDSTRFSSQTEFTPGVYVQNEWDACKLFTLETGLRGDYSLDNGFFVLPRVSALFKITENISSRIGSGMGYRTPTLISGELNETDYQYLDALNESLDAEKSVGANWDINYAGIIRDKHSLTFNQAFFFTQIFSPIDSQRNAAGLIEYYNEDNPVRTLGTETFILAHLFEKLEIYLGYVFTEARRIDDNENPHLSLIAQHKFSTVFAYEPNEHWMIGIESSLFGKQYLDDGSTTDPYLFMAGMLSYHYNHFTVALNCENILDYRQNQNHSVVIPPYDNPTFKQLWAPIDGRLVNISANWSF